MTEIHQAIEQLNATLHPKPDTIELTEAMKITAPVPIPVSPEITRQQLIDAVESSLHAELPQLIATAVDAALAAQNNNIKDNENNH